MSKNKVVLVVDDEEMLTELVKMRIELEREDLNILTASNGHDAFNIVQSQKVDFVLSDIRMPDGDGVKLLENIKQYNPKIPVVCLVTGYAEVEIETLKKKGAIDVLSKPINFVLLMKYLRENL